MGSRDSTTRVRAVALVGYPLLIFMYWLLYPAYGKSGATAILHTIDGHASPDVPPIDVQQGQRVKLQIVNATDEYHPMHLHGHVFSVLARDGDGGPTVRPGSRSSPALLARPA